MKTKFFLSLLVILVAFGAVLNAQVTKGSLTGDVVDQSGAAVEGAQVKATETQTGTVLNTTSDRVGAFRFNLIPPGNYTVEITKQGFKKVVAKAVVNTGVEASVGQMKLTIGSAETEISVVAESALINTEQAQVANTFSTTSITTFSSVGENEGLDRLAQFVPGVISSRENNFSNSNGGGGFSVNGLRGRNNDQQIDGQNNNDNSVGGPSTFLSNAEFVAEYNIVTNNFGPEYGRNAGSVVNVVTKSGGNAFHGSGFWSYNSDSLNAMTNVQKNFDGLTSLPSLSDAFGGYTLGGPVVKNRVFFFSGFDTEQIGQMATGASSYVTPTPAGIALLTACFPNSSTIAALAAYGPYSVTAGNPTPSGLEATTKNISIGFAEGAPVCQNVPFDTVYRAVSGDAKLYDYIEKLDWRGNKDTIGGRYLYQKATYISAIGSVPLGYAADQPGYSHNGRLDWTRSISNRMTNDLAVTFSRMNATFGGGGTGTIPAPSGMDNALAYVTVGGYQAFGVYNSYPQQRTVQTWQVQDNWNYSIGTHNLKAGINWTYQRSMNQFLPNLNGSYSFKDWTYFANNAPTSVSIAVGDPNLDFREYDTFAYVGDDWKVKPNLTVNFGLTWSYYGQPANLFYENDMKREQSANNIWNSSLPLSVRVAPKLPAITNSFGPSIGFAYTPKIGNGFLGDGKTVIRGGYRLSYDPPFYNIYLNMASSAPQVLATTKRNDLTDPNNPIINYSMPSDISGPVVRTSLAESLPVGTADPRSYSQTIVSPNFGPDHVSSWSFGIQRELSKSVVAEVRYVGNHGSSLFQSVNGNPYIAGLAADYPDLLPAGVTPCANGRVICDMGVVRLRQNSGYSDYNGLQTELRTQQLFKQLSMRAAYTWSKTTDNVSEIYGTGTAGNTTAFAQNPLNYTNAEHAISGLDVPHKFAISFVEELPFMRKQSGLLGHALGGWGLSADYVWASGQPYTPWQYAVGYYSGGSNYYDYSFNASYAGGYDNTRPFVGSLSAPVTQVGIYAGDLCSYDGAAGCGLAANTLVSFNAYNSAGDVTAVDKSAVRYIVNAPTSQEINGTPFGNAGRNSVRDAAQNIANLKIFKNTKISERVSMEFHVTMLNAFNHRNFAAVDSWIDDAGYDSYYNGFGRNDVTSGGARTILFGGKITF